MVRNFNKIDLISCLVLLSLLFGFFQTVYAGNDQSLDKASALQKRLDLILKPSSYNYSSAGKVDPFRPFFDTVYDKQESLEQPVVRNEVKKEIQPPKFCATKLECMDVGQLTLVAIIKADSDQHLAMAQDASGVGYILRRGMKMGYRNGRIDRISSDRVVVVEDEESITGNIVKRERTLYLHPEEN